jgi:hypothetical protein
MRGIAVNINLQRRREEVFWRQRFHCYFSPPARRRSSDGPGFSTDEALDLLGTRLASAFYGAASRPDRGRAEKGGWNTVVGYRPQLARGGSALSPRWCCLRVTLPTAGTLLRWSRTHLSPRSVNGGNSISFRSTRTACFAGRMPRPRSWA